MFGVGSLAYCFIKSGSDAFWKKPKVSEFSIPVKPLPTVAEAAFSTLLAGYFPSSTTVVLLAWTRPSGSLVFAPKADTPCAEATVRPF